MQEEGLKLQTSVSTDNRVFLSRYGEAEELSVLITKHGPVTLLAKLHECMNSGVRVIYEYAALNAGWY